MKKISFLILSILILVLYACSDGESEYSAGVSSNGEAVSETGVSSEANSQEDTSNISSTLSGNSDGESSITDVSLPEGGSTPDESTDSKPNESDGDKSDATSDVTDTESSLTPPDDSSDDVSGTTSENTSSETPNESSQVPDESSSVPDDSSNIPDESSNVPDESSQIPDESSNDPNESTDAPDNSNGSEDEPMPDASTAELLPTGYLIYNGAAYTRTYFSAEVSQKYADVYARYARLFPATRISVINPPQSAINIINPEVAAMMGDPGAILDQMEADIYGDVNFINLKETFIAHRGEYLYFKSDYHWTQLGAYYTYCEYAKSIGITPLALSDFEERIISDSFIGRAYDYAQDERILSFYDTIYAYMPTKEHTMTVYNSDGSIRRVFDNCITSRDSYSCFIDGDNPVTVINVPENDQNKTVIVIKESSGNAFVPFLTEHYGNIIVIDPRHIMFDISDVVNDYEVDDIIFFAMSSTANRETYCNYYKSLIGE